MSGRVTMSADRIAASVDQPETASANGSKNCSMTLFIFVTEMSCFLPYALLSRSGIEDGQRDAYGFGSLPEKKGNQAVCFLIFMSIRMSQCPPPGKREPLGYTGPEAKGAGRPVSLDNGSPDLSTG